MTRRRIYWLCQIAGWVTGGAASLVIQMLDPSARRVGVLLAYAGSTLLAIAWSHGYHAAIRRWRWTALGFARLAPRLVVAILGLGVVMTASATLVWGLALDHVGPVLAWAPQALFGWIMAVLLWNLLYFSIHFFERVQRLEVERLQLAIVAKDAQLHGLMAQLQPHFLFNCLNSVRGLIVEDPAKAQATVTQLASLMRYSLQATTDSTVSLAAELDMVRTYLALEAVRFDERLRAEIDVADGITELPVPAMLVQSLVENGVKHGIERSPGGGTIRVAAWRDGPALRIRVVNPGRLGTTSTSTQIGLANARERLRLLYGPGAPLAIGDSDGTVTAEVAIPLAPADRGPAAIIVGTAGARAEAGLQ